jgi:hypothetical protein
MSCTAQPLSIHDLAVRPVRSATELHGASSERLACYAPVEFPLEDGLSAANRGVVATLVSIGVDMFR